MTAKEYLSKIHIYRKMLLSSTERIEELYAEASGVKAIVYDKDRVQVSPENRFESVMTRIEAEADKWARLRLKYEAEVRRRETQILNMPNPAHVKVLTYRYLDLDSKGDLRRFEEIACLMNMDYGWVRHLHSRALGAFARMYGFESRHTKTHP